MNGTCSFCAMEKEDLASICQECLERRANLVGLALRLAAEFPDSPTSKELRAEWHELEIVSDIAEALLDQLN